MIDDLLTSTDRAIVRKLLTRPPQALTEEEVSRLSYGNGLVFRLTKSWEAQDDAIRAVVAMQTVTDLQQLVPRMVTAFEKLVSLEERREKREDLRAAGIWGKQGAIAGGIALASSGLTILGAYLMGAS